MRLEGETGRGKALAPPLPPPRFPGVLVTRSPLTAALYYLNALNRLGERVLALTPLFLQHESKL